jgi:3-keto-5-aminohexanoate cleavage enzyme
MRDGSSIAITSAVTGAETTRAQNPALPVTPAEIADAACEARRAGAAIVHLHVRDDQGRPTQDAAVFKEAMALIREKCDIVIEVTTGGAAGMSAEERLQPVALDPEMASLDCGTVNFGEEHIVNTLPMMRRFASKMRARGIRPTLECFDLSHIDAAWGLVEAGLVPSPLHFGLVLNVPGGLRYSRDTVRILRDRLPEGALWTLIGIGGRIGTAKIEDALDLGGWVRVGMEDNIYFDKGRLAASNAELVARAAHMVRERGLTVASPDEVRSKLSLRAS